MRCDAIRFDAMRCDSMRFDSMRCDSIRFDSIRFDDRSIDDAEVSVVGEAIGQSNVLPVKRTLKGKCG